MHKAKTFCLCLLPPASRHQKTRMDAALPSQPLGKSESSRTLHMTESIWVDLSTTQHLFLSLLALHRYMLSGASLPRQINQNASRFCANVIKRVLHFANDRKNKNDELSSQLVLYMDAGSSVWRVKGTSPIYNEFAKSRGTVELQGTYFAHHLIPVVFAKGDLGLSSIWAIALL